MTDPTNASQAAEITAIKALAWLAANDDLLPVFLGASGLAREDLAQRAAEPEFLGAVLDFLIMDDAWVMAFCEHEGLAFDAPRHARQALPGGAEIHWT